MAQFLDHLHIILHTLLDTGCFHLIAQILEVSYLLHQIVLNLADGDVGLFLRGHKEIGWIEPVVFKLSQSVEGHTVHLLEGIDLVVPERHPQHHLTIRHRNINGVAFYAEVSTL